MIPRIVFFISVSLLIIFNLLSSRAILANNGGTDCDNRYVTLINPVRGRNLWIDKTINPLKSQYNLAKEYKVPVTWLLQYDALEDEEIFKETKKFDPSHEMGVFLEVSPDYAQRARVIYPHAVPWFSPRAVFLSGYSQSQRRNLIDKLFSEFKIKYGFYPKSVGAWWIDSYSLNYMKDKYDIKSTMIVADQKNTDNYGVWGQWWGVPYYPSKANILTPASSLKNKQDIVVIQWAQRDPTLAYGEGPEYSNYSLQANDYKRQGKDTNYFKDLVNVYLDCQNPIGQITVGLETGIESVGYIKEYDNQLRYLSEIKGLKVVTMSEFSDVFSSISPQYPKRSELSDKDSSWILKTDSRNNSMLGDYIKYQQDIAFKDFFIPDNQDFLDRNLRELIKDKLSYFPWFLYLVFIVGVLSLYKKLFSIWVVGTLFAVLSFGLILRSNYQFGWQVFYGPRVSFLIFTQIILVLISYLIIWLLSKRNFIKKNRQILWFIPLSFGIDYIIQALRFSFISEKYYIGFALDSLKFVGFSFAKPFTIEVVNKDFPSFLAAGLLKFDFTKIWDSLYLSLLIYPLVHILLAVVPGYFFIKLPHRIRKILIGAFIILTALYLINIFQADPRLVQ